MRTIGLVRPASFFGRRAQFVWAHKATLDLTSAVPQKKQKRARSCQRNPFLSSLAETFVTVYYWSSLFFCYWLVWYDVSGASPEVPE